jgi:hypothetical protein
LAGFVSGVILARPFTTEARAVAQPARLAIAAFVIALPLALLAQPLVAENGKHTASLTFARELREFGTVEAEIVRRQTEILTFPSNVRVNRFEIARRLRTEVLQPWRAASKPLLESATLPDDGSHFARLQTAMRNYLRARDKAIALRVLALETGDASDESQAVAADARLGATLNEINALMREE